uniref:Uncharacterized protein n=1 Tax=Branchiostoma floridae TaxID=7739 RepID=C3YKQ4_BRAFL|eukprot:XP_002603111.1 hypothetical protein BRAFLDRAFT_116957 [Branchiostoma floridae]
MAAARGRDAIVKVVRAVEGASISAGSIIMYVQMATSTIRYGMGVTQEVGMDFQNMGAKKVCLMTDKTVGKLPPMQIVLEAMTKAGINFEVYDNIRVEPTDSRSLDDDMLLPFPSFEKWPRHSHRHVRDCQPDIFGNATHETFPAHRNSNITVPSTTRYFVTKVVDSLDKVKNGYGHYTVINNPLRTFSVVEPGGSNGCIEHRRRTVENTSQARTCHVAVNAGFFNTHTGACLGNLVTDGKRIQDSGGIQNANFGIRKDGTIVVG